MTKDERARLLQRDFHELARPFVRMKCDILEVSLPTIKLYPDGRMETVYSPEVMLALAKVDLLWAEAKQSLLELWLKGKRQ